MAIENRGPELQAVGYTLVSVAIVSILLRCYVRIFKVKSFGFDDWCMIFATITFSLFVASALVGVHYGTGRHYWDLEGYERELAMKYWWFCYIWYCLTMIASKVSIGHFLLRIAVRPLHVWIIYGVMLITALTGVVFFFVTMFQCNPIPFFWDKDIKGTCISMDVIIALTYLYSACSVICDFSFALLPIAIVWQLNMNKKSKVALIPILAMACVASAAVLVRFPYVKDFKNPDFLYATVDIAIWSTTEQGLAITAGSLATLRPLFRSVGRYLGWSEPGPAELKDSPPSATIGGLSSGGKASRRGLYSLTTFMRDDSNGDLHMVSPEAGGRSDDRYKGPHSTTWNVVEDSGVGSEEELTSKNRRP